MNFSYFGNYNYGSFILLYNYLFTISFVDTSEYKNVYTPSSVVIINLSSKLFTDTIYFRGTSILADALHTHEDFYLSLNYIIISDR